MLSFIRFDIIAFLDFVVSLKPMLKLTKAWHIGFPIVHTDLTVVKKFIVF